MPNGNGNAAAVDLSGLGLDALRTLRQAVEERIGALETERREAAFQALEEIARRHGLTKTEVARHFRGKRKKPRAPVRYRNPENPGETWTGRGRRPKWVDDQIASGKALEELQAAS